jgi:cytoskeletal protein CcmA (bactofilin family)
MASLADTDAVIGKAMVMKGHIHSEEPLTVQGRVEGTIEIREHLLTVASGANVQARITARNIEVQGRVEGQIEAAEIVYIRKDAEFIGDIHAAGLVIEEGSFIKANIDLTRKPTESSSERSPEDAPLSSPLGELAEAVLLLELSQRSVR